MRLFIHTILILFSCLVVTNGLYAKSLKKRTSTIHIGSTSVKLVQYTYGKGKFFIHLHENETTAKRAALSYIKNHGGHLLTITHNGERNISFCLRNKFYSFDPNRIFTPKGIEQTLKSQGHYSSAAARKIQKLAHAILKHIPREGKIIAVHNNKEYSMLDYFNSLHKDARAVHYIKQASLRNFYFVTKENGFCRLKSSNFNVVWQTKRPQDDGSLSVKLKKRQYINVEAAYDAYAIQLKMLAYA